MCRVRVFSKAGTDSEPAAAGGGVGRYTAPKPHSSIGKVSTHTTHSTHSYRIVYT